MDLLRAPANAKLLDYFASRRLQYGYPIDPEIGSSIAEVHGTHPDLITRLWRELGGSLPADCHAVVYGSAVLRHPQSGIVFAFAGGTHAYAMRLPEDVRALATAAGATRVHRYATGSTFDLASIGPEWVFCRWFKGEEDWCRAAYGFATDL